jgi:hypothetical protein
VNEDVLSDPRLTLRGASGAERRFRLASLAASRERVPAAYVLLGRYRQGGEATVLHVGEADDLEAALAVHREYPCMQSFADEVGWLPVESAEERPALAADLAAQLRPICEGCWPPVLASDSENGAPYPVSKVGSCVAECVQLDQRVEEAIQERRVIRFAHGRDHVEAEPHEYGLTGDGVATLFAYCTGYGAGRGNVEPWTAFPLSEIHGLVITDRTARGARPIAPSPIEVAFSSSRSQPAAIASEIDEVVRGLHAQMLELRRVEARACRLRYRMSESDAPSELSVALAGVEAEQACMREAILALIPIVAGLQRAAAKAAST